MVSLLGVGVLEYGGSPTCVGDVLNIMSAVFFAVHIFRTKQISRSTNMEKFFSLLGHQLPSSSQQSKSQLVGNEDDIHKLQKTIEEMCIELENEREERERLPEQRKADKETFEAQLAKVMAIFKGQDKACSPSPDMSHSLVPSPSSSA